MDRKVSAKNISLITKKIIKDFLFIVQFKHRTTVYKNSDSVKYVSFTTGHFCKKIYYFPLKFLAQFSATMSSFTGIYS